MKGKNRISDCNELFIIDLNGHKITVENLDKAIEQADRMKGYWHKDNNFAQLDSRLHTYWADMHDKLKALKKPK